MLREIVRAEVCADQRRILDEMAELKAMIRRLVSANGVYDSENDETPRVPWLQHPKEPSVCTCQKKFHWKESPSLNGLDAHAEEASAAAEQASTDAVSHAAGATNEARPPPQPSKSTAEQGTLEAWSSIAIHPPLFKGTRVQHRTRGLGAVVLIDHNDTRGKPFRVKFDNGGEPLS